MKVSGSLPWLRGGLLALALPLAAVAAQAASPMAPAQGTASGSAATSLTANDAAIADLQKAVTALDKGRMKAAREQLERAQTTLLNSEEADRGTSIDTHQAMPESKPMREIIDARTHLHNRSQAVQSVNQAIADLRGSQPMSQAPASGSL